MRIETPGFLHVLKALALIGAYILVFRYGFDFMELAYDLSTVDWVSAAFFIVPAVLLLCIPAWRLLREYRIWKVLHQPFHTIDDPFIDVDLKEESFGDAILANGSTIKQTATFASRSGVIVRKAAYPKMFPTFEITWEQISNIYFVELQKNEKLGADPIGIARVTLKFAEEVILVLPWRRRFNQFVPEHIGLQKETLVR